MRFYFNLFTTTQFYIYVAKNWWYYYKNFFKKEKVIPHNNYQNFGLSRIFDKALFKGLKNGLN